MIVLGAAIGVVVGLSLGALGAGGSILTVPALVYVLGQAPRLATTGSLVIVGLTALTGVTAHARAGRVRLADGLLVGAVAIPGSVLGARLSASVDPDVLLAAFAALMLVAAAAMGRRARARGGTREGSREGAGTRAGEGPREGAGTRAGEGPRARGAVAVARLVAVATGIGLLTGFFGVGGGFLVVPALVLAVGLSMPVATGTSLVVIAVTSVTALITRLGGGVALDWSVLAVFTAAAMVGSLLGSRVVSRVSPARLTGAFSLVLVAIALYTAARSVPALVASATVPS